MKSSAQTLSPVEGADKRGNQQGCATRKFTLEAGGGKVFPVLLKLPFEVKRAQVENRLDGDARFKELDYDRPNKTLEMRTCLPYSPVVVF
ncbi:MAG: hypothetical protein DMF76_16580 [Acidobacteria bacterium]|nr:MAG: hypothetical protein DMF76_16580 [Acidobacteriota bacterium]